MCDVDGEGAIGLVLNRPSRSPVHDYLPQWSPGEPSVVFVGGPVQPEIAVGLAEHSGQSPIGFTEISGDIGLFDLATPVELVSGALSQLRVFSGYCGWARGQLEDELAAGDWIVVASEPDDPFTADAERLWTAVLRRQGGELATLADIPVDPRLN